MTMMPRAVKKGVVLRNQAGARFRVLVVHKGGCDAEIIESPDTRVDLTQRVGERLFIDVRDIERPDGFMLEASRVPQGAA